MPDNPGRARERDAFFWLLFLGITTVGFLLGFLAHQYQLGTSTNDGFKVAKAWVTAADLLSTLVLASLITMPLTVVYLLSKERELQVTIAKETVYHLEQAGVTLTAFRSAYLFLADPGTPEELTAVMRSLGEFAGVSAATKGDTLSVEALVWLLPDEERRRNYNRYFADGGDRRTLSLAAIVLGIAAGVCFAVLYLRYLGATGSWLDLIEQAVVPMTAGYNVFAYVMLIRIVQLKSGIKRQAAQQLRLMCGLVREAVAAALSATEALQQSMRNDLNQDLDTTGKP